MCGIVGYVGDNSASPILIDGLKKLEYRGYDSAGIAVCRNGKITTVKTKGRISDLQQKLDEVGTPQGSVGIGHTRWATHARRPMQTPIPIRVRAGALPSSTTVSSKTILS